MQIPKETSQMIFLEDLLKSKDFKNTDATLLIILGTDTFGNIMIKDLRDIPHMLVAGQQELLLVYAHLWNQCKYWVNVARKTYYLVRIYCSVMQNVHQFAFIRHT